MFETIAPHPILTPYIKHYWTLAQAGDCVAHERTLPTGCLSLIFHKGNRLQASGSKGLQPRSFISGQTSGYFDVVASGEVNMIVVVFQPLGCKPFFVSPINKFFNDYVSVDDLEDESLKVLERQVQDAADNRSSIRCIERYFISRLHRAESYNHKRMEAAIRTINNRTSVGIYELADITCLSQKQFTRVFTEYIGAKPKEFSRVVRFQRALHTLQMNPGISLTQLSFECGYYDQPHLIREFKSFSGYTPREYLTICEPYSDYFSVVV